MLSHEKAADVQQTRREAGSMIGELEAENAKLRADLAHRTSQLHSAVTRIGALKSRMDDLVRRSLAARENSRRRRRLTGLFVTCDRCCCCFPRHRTSGSYPPSSLPPFMARALGTPSMPHSCVRTRAVSLSAPLVPLRGVPADPAERRADDEERARKGIPRGEQAA
jgi:hypothetical protein